MNRKKINLILVVGTIFFVLNGQAQNLSNLWGNGTDNCGVGPFGSQPTNKPNFNFQIHGIADWTAPTPRTDGEFLGSLNQGKTSRFGMTNTTTGKASFDGMEFRMSELDFSMTNQEGGDLTLLSGGAIMTFKGATQNIHTGPSFFRINDEEAKFNIFGGTRHGLNIKTVDEKSCALNIQTKNPAPAINVFGEIQGRANFSVNGMGQVFGTKIAIGEQGVNAYGTLVYAKHMQPSTSSATLFLIENADQKLVQIDNQGLLKARRIIVDQQTWADYVFEKDYKLMPLNEVARFIETNKHLPNVPSEKEMLEKGSDVSEMNRILMEKVEELTLYLIQQNDMIQKQAAELQELKNKLK